MIILNKMRPEQEVLIQKVLVRAQAGSDDNVLATPHQCGGPGHLGWGGTQVLGAGRILPARVRVDRRCADR